MSATTIFATKNREDANQHILNKKALGHNVIEIKSTDVIEFVNEGTEQDPWYSGAEAEWIVLVSTPEKFTSPGLKT